MGYAVVLRWNWAKKIVWTQKLTFDNKAFVNYGQTYGNDKSFLHSYVIRDDAKNVFDDIHKWPHPIFPKFWPSPSSLYHKYVLKWLQTPICVTAFPPFWNNVIYEWPSLASYGSLNFDADRNNASQVNHCVGSVLNLDHLIEKIPFLNKEFSILIRIQSTRWGGLNLSMSQKAA